MLVIPEAMGAGRHLPAFSKEKETRLCDVTTSKTTGPCHPTAEATARLLKAALEGIANKPCECSSSCTGPALAGALYRKRESHGKAK